jgi:cysteine desulfurase
MHRYLDNNATTALSPEVKAAMLAVMDLPLNPSSVHAEGQKARRFLDDTRAKLLSVLSAPADTRAVFTSSGTEANNLFLRGVVPAESIFFISSVEHSSLRFAVDEWPERAKFLPVDQFGRVEIAALAENLKQNSAPVWVSVMAANNETGVLQPLAEIAETCKRFGAFLHVDATQAIGKIPFSLQDFSIDACTISAHKFSGPQGAAALVMKKIHSLSPILRGGGQERGFRSGTENVAAIVGFGAALSNLESYRVQMAKTEALRDEFEARIQEISIVETVIAKSAKRLPNTSCLRMPGVGQETQLIHFDLAKIAVSAGSACSSGKVTPSAVLLAMGLSQKDAAEAIRVSFGVNSSSSDVEAAVSAWKELWLRTR